MLRDQLFKITTRALEHLLHRVVLVPLEEREGGGRALGRLERLRAAAEVLGEEELGAPVEVDPVGRPREAVALVSSCPFLP